MFRVCSTPRVNDSLEMNSIDTRPTSPILRMMERKCVSVIPAMGARTSGGSMARFPMRNIRVFTSGSRGRRKRYPTVPTPNLPTEPCRMGGALPLKKAAMAVAGWYAHHARDLPWRREVTPYRVLVSEIMLQQTTVETVTPYFERFLSTFPTIRALAKADIRSVLG